MVLFDLFSIHNNIVKWTGLGVCGASGRDLYPMMPSIGTLKVVNKVITAYKVPLELIEMSGPST